MSVQYPKSIRHLLRRPARRAAMVHVLACGLVALAGAWPCWAAPLTVTNTNDSGSGSLRNAIATAASGDTIQFSVTGTITLTSGVLIVNKNLTIQGPGAAQLAVSGGGASQVLFVGPSVTISISGLTIENGNAGTGGAGGGIENQGTLTVTNSTLSGNSARFGGAIANYPGTTLTVTNTTLSGNSASSDGGGIFNGSGSRVTITNSTLSGNSSSGLDGGGIENGGTLTVTNTTLSGNSALSQGGGINNESTLTVTNSTLSGNSAGFGGGIRNNGTLIVNSSTLADNSAFSGGGIQNDATLTVKGTLVVSNPGGNCGGGAVTSAGYNLSDDAACMRDFTQPTDINSTPAQLDPKGLQNNGGPTQTIALLSTSPAVDAIPVAACTDTNGTAIAADQRGVTRPQGSGCDIGAFELVQNMPFSYFSASLAILTGKPSGFGLTAWLTLGSASDGIHPLSEAVTLQIANYGVTIPAGSFHQLWKSPQAPYVYQGTINGTKLLVGLISLGGNNYQFDAAGSPVTWTGVKNPVTVSLTIGDDTGTMPVTAVISTR